MAEIPQDLDEQFEFGIKVARNSYRQKVSSLEAELGALQQQLRIKESQVGELSRKVTSLSEELQDSEVKCRNLTEENARLSAENANLAQKNRKLKADLAKLFQFKKAIIETFNEDELPPNAHAVPSGILDDYSQAQTSSSLGKSGGLSGYSSNDSGASPFRTGSSNLQSTSTLRASPGTKGSAIPDNDSETMALIDQIDKSLGQGVYSGTRTSQELSSGSDGNPNRKDFFRQARHRLSIEHFHQLLNNIKRLNNHAQTRTETLQKAREIFGAENKDLYETFRQLISRTAM